MSATVAEARGARILHHLVHLSSAAPGCAGLPVDDARRWRIFWCRTTEQVVCALLGRLRRAPDAVHVRGEGEDPPLDGADLIAVVDGQPAAIAAIVAGATPFEVAAVLDRLIARRWRPSFILQTKGDAHG